MEEIHRKKGIYKFNEISLYYGRKIIDINNAQKNLSDFKILMDEGNIFFGLIYGTLLGAVREKNFIAYDEDVDVFVLDEDREAFLDLLEKFRNVGFEVARYKGDLLSLIRNDDYIDIYFFRKGVFSKYCNGDSIPNSFFKKYGKISFCDKEYFIFEEVENFLIYAYGKDWMVPKKNNPAIVISNYTKFKNIIKKILPGAVVEFLSKLKN